MPRWGLVWRFLLFTMVFGAVKSIEARTNKSRLNSKEVLLIQQIERVALHQLNTQIQHSLMLAKCFRKESDCPEYLASELPSLLPVIQSHNRDYRMLAGLVQTKQIQRGYASIHPMVGLPAIEFAKSRRNGNNNDSEYQRLLNIIEADKLKLAEFVQKQWNLNKQKANFIGDGQQVRDMVSIQERDANRIYRVQLMLVIQKMPFVIWIQDEEASPDAIANSLDKLANETQELRDALTTKSDENWPVFVSFEPATSMVLKNASAETLQIYDGLVDKATTHLSQKWFWERLLSGTAAGFATCTFVASITGAWPLAIFCGFVGVGLSVKNTSKAVANYRQTFKEWISGISTYKDLVDSRSEIIYNAIMMAVFGQGLASTLATNAPKLTLSVLESLRLIRAEMTLNLRSVQAFLISSATTTKSQLRLRGKDAIAENGVNVISLANLNFRVVTVSIPKLKWNLSMLSNSIITYNEYIDIFEFSNSKAVAN